MKKSLLLAILFVCILVANSQNQQENPSISVVNDQISSDSNLELPDYFEVFVVQKDDDILPVGTEYFVSSMLTGSVLKSETTQNEITLGDLKRLLASEGSFRHSFYALKLINNNEVKHPKYTSTRHEK